MSYGSPVDPVGGTIISSIYAITNILEPIRWLRLMTGNADPPGPNYIVASDSTIGTSWRKVTADLIQDGTITGGKFAPGAVNAHLGYVPMSTGGGTFTGSIGQTMSLGGITFVLRNLDTASTSGTLGILSPDGATWQILVRNGLIQMGSGSQPIQIGGDLDVSGLLKKSGGNVLDRANHTGVQLASTISNLAAAVATMTSLSSGSATSASNAAALGGVPASGYPTLAGSSAANNFTNVPQAGGVSLGYYVVGTYTGSADQDLNPGYTPRAVLVIGTNGANAVVGLIASVTNGLNVRASGNATTGVVTACTGSRLLTGGLGGVGFRVSAADGLSASGYSYTYIAFK